MAWKPRKEPKQNLISSIEKSVYEMAWKPRKEPKQNLLPASTKHIIKHRISSIEKSVYEALASAIDTLIQDQPQLNEIEIACIKLRNLYSAHCTSTPMSKEHWNVYLVLKSLNLRDRKPEVIEAVHNWLEPFFEHQLQLFDQWKQNNPKPSPEDLERCDPLQILSNCVYKKETLRSFLGMNRLG